MSSDQSAGKGSRILICKWGASGDVLRTTPLLEALEGFAVDWIVSPKNAPLLRRCNVRVVTGVDELDPQTQYDVVFSLEEDAALVSRLMSRIRYRDWIGTYVAPSGQLAYTDSSRGWFDMSLISRFGRNRANRLKIENRRTYQHCLFEMAGISFRNERYVRLAPVRRQDTGSVLLAPDSGSRWPSKRWAFYEQLADTLRGDHHVEWLDEHPSFESLATHISGFSAVVANDSLPLHVCLSESVRVCGLFICTSPWEIHDYGLLNKVTSPSLQDFFYSPDFHAEAVQSIALEAVTAALSEMLSARSGD